MPADPAALTTPDGRRLEYRVTGAPAGPAVLFHTGTPGATVDFSGVTAAASALGIRLIGYSRPGYGDSTPQPGRSVADAVGDVVVLLDELGVGEFRALGWSGGGPHALACAALLPGRCQAAALIAGVAPFTAHGLDFLDGMDQANHDEFGAAVAGFDALDAFLQPEAESLRGTSAEKLTEELGGLLSDADRRALGGALLDELALASRRAVANGVAGWRDDDLAFSREWGFAPADIGVPVAVWQGREDRMVPFAHGQWLAAEIPGAVSHLLEHEGHVSLIGKIDAILADLVALGS